MKNLKEYLEISDYEKPKDYQFTQNNFEELNRINKLLVNCVKYDFQKFNLIMLIDYYIYFFEEIGKFELLFLGFHSLKSIAQSNELYNNESFKHFITALSINFDNLNCNLIREDLKNIHYYDVSFISDIEQFRQSIHPCEENVCDIDLF